jgi:hypothetical protein
MSADAADAGMANGAVPGTGEGAEVESQEGAQGTEAEETQPDQADELRKWKDMARKHEKRARENAAAAARLKTIEDANMSDVEKARAALAEAEHERDEARNMHARMMAAATHDLPVDLIDFLGSGTEEEINERAELLASVIEETAQAIADQLMADLNAGRNGNGNQGQQTSAARPVESMRAGSAPAGTAPASQEQWFRQLLGQ